MSAPVVVRPGAEPFSLGRGPIGVLMIHGLTGSPASMRPIGEWLAARGCAVEGIRLPGHGASLDDLRASRWTDWVDEATRGVDALVERARTIVVFGQSMGGAVAVVVIAARPHQVHGLALANPYLFDARHALAPIVRWYPRDLRGVGNDIAMAGQDENADPALPVPAAIEMAALTKVARSELPGIRQPVVLFRSGADHVIPRSNARKTLQRIGSSRTELVECPRSYHVVTLDHDAPLVRDRVLAFARELDEERE